MTARLHDLIAAEWIKLWSLRSTAWILGLGAPVVIGINVNSALSNADLLERQSAISPDGAFRIDPMHAAFVDPAFQILVVIATSVGAISVFGEYTSGLIRTTFAAVPDRRAVLVAKVAVITAVMTVLGAIVAAASFGATQAVLSDTIGLPISAPGALRAVLASALLAPLSALVGMALGAVIRHAAGTVAASLVTLLLLPSLFAGETYRWVKEIGNAMPLSAWQALVENPAMDYPAGRYPVTITEAWAVFAVWPLVAAAVAVVVVHRRDV
ncbi:ABC transporter permease subunit [Streptomyces sp. MZ04]|uniref:ABC transporter permease subunit n=1 Tax=Streptomyces sp. MZ04 TaxID=2559236 RepID=UPI00107EC802|nr:ABC transporter permease subunit [Streptomyces sp. MZ04]TGB11045.1 ABC transporter permease [Streptomyces sp. MZ04]